MLSKLKSKSLVIISTTVVTIAIIGSAYLFLNKNKKEIEKLEGKGVDRYGKTWIKEGKNIGKFWNDNVISNTTIKCLS